MTRQWGAIAAIIFAATLAYVVGVRLSESAMAVVIGVLFGVAASIPMSLILVFALQRGSACRESKGSSDPQQPTIIVAPPAISGYQGNPWGGNVAGQMYLPPFDEGGMPAPRRSFRIIGGEED